MRTLLAVIAATVLLGGQISAAPEGAAEPSEALRLRAR